MERPFKEVVQAKVEDLEEELDHQEEGDHIILLLRSVTTISNWGTLPIGVLKRDQHHKVKRKWHICMKMIQV